MRSPLLNLLTSSSNCAVLLSVEAPDDLGEASSQSPPLLLSAPTFSPHISNLEPKTCHAYKTPRPEVIQLNANRVTLFELLLDIGSASWTYGLTSPEAGRSHWLAVLLRIEYESYFKMHDVRVRLSQDVTFQSKFFHPEGCPGNSTFEARYCAVTLAKVLKQIVSLQEDVPELDIHDAVLELRAIDRLMDDTRTLTDEIDRGVQRRIGDRNLTLANRTIEETRSVKTRKHASDTFSHNF